MPHADTRSTGEGEVVTTTTMETETVGEKMQVDETPGKRNSLATLPSLFFRPFFQALPF